jgi:hypothetical protein
MLPLEAYRARYTDYLFDIEQKAFGKDFELAPVVPENKDGCVIIQSGEVLDTVARPMWALEQMRLLLQSAPNFGKVWFSDFFHPGLSALPYTRGKFQAFSYLWAQTFDIYDFSRQFVDWMRPWECAAFGIYQKVFVASPLLKDKLIVSLGDRLYDQVEVVGLPFSSAHCFAMLGGVLPEHRTFDVAYSSRWDQEKNPGVFVELVKSRPDLRFVVCCGHAELKGNATDAVLEIKRLAALPNANVQIAAGLTKAHYYAILADSKVQFNCAVQDWVSFTLLEALTFGCLPLYPNWRDFPDTLLQRQRNLYAPASLVSINEKLEALLTSGTTKEDTDHAGAILNYHDGTLSRISESILTA